jgi:hypothetical protein
MSFKTTLRHSLLVAAMLGAIGIGSALADDSATRPTSCLNRENIRSTKVIDDRNILFTTRDRTTYNNQLSRHCPGMRRNTVLSFTYADHKLCAGSTFTVLIRTGASSNQMPYTNPGTNEHFSLQGPSFVQGATCQLSGFGPISDDEIKALMAATDTQRRSRRRSDRDAVKAEPVEAAPEKPSQPAK